MGEISHKAPSSTWVNSLFSTSVGLFNQIVCFFFCSTKEDNILLGNLAGTFGGYYLGNPKAWNCFLLVTFPRGVVLGCFYPFLCIFTFSIFLYFLRIIQSLHNKNFNKRSWYYSYGYLTKKPLCSISSSARSHFQVFWGLILRCFQLYLESCPILSYEICIDAFCINLIVNAVRKISQHGSFC